MATVPEWMAPLMIMKRTKLMRLIYWMRKSSTSFQNKDKLFYRIGHNAEFDARVAKWIATASGESRRGTSAPAQIMRLDRIVDEMRLHKDENEIELMQLYRYFCRSHTLAMQKVRPGMMEYALEAELNYIFGKMAVYHPITVLSAVKMPVFCIMWKMIKS